MSEDERPAPFSQTPAEDAPLSTEPDTGAEQTVPALTTLETYVAANALGTNGSAHAAAEPGAALRDGAAEPARDAADEPAGEAAAEHGEATAEPVDEAALPSTNAAAGETVSEAAASLTSDVAPQFVSGAAPQSVSEAAAEPRSEAVAEPVGDPLVRAEDAPAAPVVSAPPALDAGPRASGPRTVGFDPSVEERKRKAEAHWLEVSGSRESGDVVTGTVTSAVKGGLLVDIGGIRGFLPASQVRLDGGAALESLVKTKVPLRVIDVDEGRRRVVVSHRRALDQQRRQKRNDLLRSLKIGARFEGTVVRLAPFGAFVDIGGIEGLIPMSELAFERVAKVEDVLAVGDTLPVTILRIEDGGKKIGLSRKNALPNPIRDNAALLRPGNVVEGTVVGKDSRLEVEIAPGVIGFVRESDANPDDYALGETVEVAVRYVDRKTRRVVLTTLHGAAAEMPRGSGFAPLGQELGRR